MNIKEYLKGKIKNEELKKVRRGFEIIGDVVIVEIPDEIEHLKNLIVQAILARHKNVKTVLRKVGIVDGVYRVAKYEILHGSKTETVAKEFGCKFLVDPTKVYYSSKLSSERERIAKMVKDGERVLVMFAGVGPYAIVIAKLAKPAEVVGVEINPIAVDYFRKNIKINKVENLVKVYEGDVKEVLPKIEGKFDRIIMPSPKTAENYVYLIRDKIKKNGWVHYYTFAGEEEEPNLGEKIRNIFKKNGIEVEIERIRACGSYAPRVNRYVADVKVLRIHNA